jgi:hypothetical protein
LRYQAPIARDSQVLPKFLSLGLASLRRLWERSAAIWLADKGTAMLIKREVLEAIKQGDITVQFRRWTRPSVRAGGTLKTKVGLLRIGRIDEMRPEDVTLGDARQAGFKDVAEFQKWLNTMKQGPLFHRIEVSYLGEAPTD